MAPKSGKQAGWNGDEQQLAAVLKHFVEAPGFLPSANYLQEATLVRQRGLWKALHGLQPNWVIAKSKLVAALLILAGEDWNFGVDQDGQPVTAQGWAEAIAERMKQVMKKLGTAFRRTPQPQWLISIVSVDLPTEGGKKPAIRKRPAAATHVVVEEAGAEENEGWKEEEEEVDENEGHEEGGEDGDGEDDECAEEGDEDEQLEESEEKEEDEEGEEKGDDDRVEEPPTKTPRKQEKAPPQKTNDTTKENIAASEDPHVYNFDRALGQAWRGKPKGRKMGAPEYATEHISDIKDGGPDAPLMAVFADGTRHVISNITRREYNAIQQSLANKAASKPGEYQATMNDGRTLKLHLHKLSGAEGKYAWRVMVRKDGKENQVVQVIIGAKVEDPETLPAEASDFAHGVAKQIYDAVLDGSLQADDKTEIRKKKAALLADPAVDDLEATGAATPGVAASKSSAPSAATPGATASKGKAAAVARQGASAAKSSAPAAASAAKSSAPAVSKRCRDPPTSGDDDGMSAPSENEMSLHC